MKEELIKFYQSVVNFRTLRRRMKSSLMFFD